MKMVMVVRRGKEKVRKEVGKGRGKEVEEIEEEGITVTRVGKTKIRWKILVC